MKSVTGSKASEASIRATMTQSRPSMSSGAYAVMLSPPMYSVETAVPVRPAMASSTAVPRTGWSSTDPPASVMRSAVSDEVPSAMTAAA